MFSPLALLVALQPPALCQTTDAPVMLDRVVAVVGDRIITASDVRLERALADRDPSPVAALARRQREGSLEAVVDGAIVRKLAGDIAIYAPSTTEVSQRVAALRQSWPDPADYARFLGAMGLDEERLAGRIYSRMVIERYVYRNVTLASETAGESPDVAWDRYQSWIGRERSRVEIRYVSRPGAR